MNRLKPQRAILTTIAWTASLAAAVQWSHGATFPLPPQNEAVERAMAAANLQTVAASTTDPDVWLGLSLLPHPGDPVRGELTEMAIRAKPEYGPLGVVLANVMDGPDDQSIAELIRQDPENALGYYLLALRLYRPGGETETLEAFRKAAGFPELRTYGGSVSNVLFKALDALNLQGVDRLCASSWLATRWSNFEVGNLQGQRTILRRLTKDADLETQKEISELMLTFAGHLIGSDLIEGRKLGQSALVAAFQLKANIAASENSPTMNGYAGAAQALVSTRLYAPGLEHRDPLDFATFLPAAFGVRQRSSVQPGRATYASGNRGFRRLIARHLKRRETPRSRRQKSLSMQHCPIRIK